MRKNFLRFALAGAVLFTAGFWLHQTSSVSSSTSSAKSTTSISDVAGLYDKKCAECHGKDGRSRSFRGKHTHARDLTDAQWQEGTTDERIYNSIENGKGKMPAFGKKLSDTEINSLVRYVRDLKK